MNKQGPLKVQRASKPSGPWRPGERVIDDGCDRLGADLVRRLLESPAILPENERWTPTRWLMKAVYEAVHGKDCALSKISSALRSQKDNEAHVVDLYRKLSGDFGSSSSEVSGTGERAHGRCNRSYVFSSQLRHWLHEVPAFVPTPTGWQPPPEPAAGLGVGAPPLAAKPAFQMTYEERIKSRPQPPPPMPLPARGTRAFDDDRENWGGPGGGAGWGRDVGPPPPRTATVPQARQPSHAAFRHPDYTSLADGSIERVDKRQGGPTPRGNERGTSSFAMPVRSGSPGRRSSSTTPRARSPARTFLAGGGFEGARAERILGSLAAGIRKRLYDDLKRPHDLFRAWDRDEDGRVSVAELLAGCAHLGLAVSPTDEPAVERALVVHFGEQGYDATIDFAAFAAWLDPHSTYRRKPAGESSAREAALGDVPVKAGVTGRPSSAAFGSSAARWGVGGLGGGVRREAESAAKNPIMLGAPINDADSPAVGQLALEVHHFLPCQKLQRDPEVKTLQVQTDFFGPVRPARLHAPREQGAGQAGALGDAAAHLDRKRLGRLE